MKFKLIDLVHLRKASFKKVLNKQRPFKDTIEKLTLSEMKLEIN